MEGSTRAAMDASTGQVDAPPPPPRRWRPWLVLAPAATIAVAVTLVAVRGAPAIPVNGVPRYYVGIPASPFLENQAAPEAIVGDTFTGEKLATVPAPAGWRFLPALAAAGDDRTFVVGATPQSGELLRTERLYVIRLTPGAAHFATLRELPIPAPQVSWDYVTSLALSRDGTMLAVLAEATQLRVYSVVTGALVHTWSVTSSGSSGPPIVSLLSWTSDGRRLAFSAREARANPPVNIRLLQVYDPGHDLFADSRVVLTVSSSGCGLVSGDGKPVVWICDTASTAPLWASDDGNAVLGYFLTGTFGTRFGLFTPGKFTPLPAPQAYPAFAAW